MRFAALLGLSLMFPVLLAGCNLSPTAPPSLEDGVAIRGLVHGGQQPVVGAHVYLLAANTTGYGGPGIAPSTANASLSLLKSASNTTKDTGSGATNGFYYVTTASDGSFSIGGDYTCTAGQQVYLYALGGNPGAGTNAASGFMAVLGSCPAAGNFAATVPYVWMNEVSTVAAAYAFAGFASDALHVSSSGTTLAQTGIANAFGNAAQLVSISTGTAWVTPETNVTAPQTEIDTLANILAACVNSNGTVTGPTNPTACYTLFNNAAFNGSSGTIPTDTATAAINIAHNPGATVANLYGLQSGVASPFQPDLSSTPNDFTVALSYSGSGFSSPRPVVIDSTGNAWVGNYAGVTRITPAGNITAYAPTGSELSVVYGLAVDQTGNVWAANDGTTYVTELTSSGALASGSPFSLGMTGNASVMPIVDAGGNIWITNYNAHVFGLTNSESTISGSPFSLSNEDWAGALDVTGNLFLMNYTSPGTIQSFSTTTHASSVKIDTLGYNDGLAIDASGNIWVASAGATCLCLYLVTPSGTLSATYAGGGMNNPTGVALDGSGNAWVSNNASVARISELSNAGVAISPSTGFTAQGLSAAGTIPQSIAVDGSGNVWVTSKSNNSVFEFLGAGTPVVTPTVANLVSPYGTAAVNKP